MKSSEIVGPLLGGIAQGLASKMNERTMLAAAAMQGLIDRFYDEEGPQLDNKKQYGPTLADARSLAVICVEAADAVLARLDEVPDPRAAKAQAINTVSDTDR